MERGLNAKFRDETGLRRATTAMKTSFSTGFFEADLRLFQRGEIFQQVTVNENVAAAHLAEQPGTGAVVEEAGVVEGGFAGAPDDEAEDEVL